MSVGVPNSLLGGAGGNFASGAAFSDCASSTIKPADEPVMNSLLHNAPLAAETFGDLPRFPSGISLVKRMRFANVSLGDFTGLGPNRPAVNSCFRLANSATASFGDLGGPLLGGSPSLSLRTRLTTFAMSLPGDIATEPEADEPSLDSRFHLAVLGAGSPGEIENVFDRPPVSSCFVHFAPTCVEGRRGVIEWLLGSLVASGDLPPKGAWSSAASLDNELELGTALFGMLLAEGVPNFAPVEKMVAGETPTRSPGQMSDGELAICNEPLDNSPLRDESAAAS